MPKQFNEPSKPQINPALEYFRQLQSAPPSTQLENFLSGFAEPKPIDSATFTAGVKKFIELANSNPVDNQLKINRKALYGNNYLGLHYNNDLVKLWNSTHSNDEHIKSSQVMSLVPSSWDSTLQDGFITLIYRGQQPAQALDELVKGPTVIDCGMFTQLSLWFGIRYMLGNERFNQCFGRTPFFITQSVYNDIEDSIKPCFGNPLYSFLARKEAAIVPSVDVKHLANTTLYPLKHPGGNYGGENCIVIDNQYYIFDPYLENTQAITEIAVLNLLRQAFNEERASYDEDRLSLYTATPEKIHPKFLQTYSQLIEEAEKLRNKKLTEKEFSQVQQDEPLGMTFDLQKFSNWLKRLEKDEQVDSTEYLPTPIDYSALPFELLNVIPFENRKSMDFSKFRQETTQQKELIAISQQFCQSVVENQSKLVILSGKAGVGKTASAVCAAKELAAIGKKIIWISEVMVNGWADQAKSMADLDNCEQEINKLLASNPDAIFLDDDNLAGFSGNLLLEKIYAWYVKNPGKGLFITSNEPINFKQCYGYKLDGQYHYPPFSHYNSPQYLNWQHKKDITGQSLRSRREGQSIGAIVSDLTWKSKEKDLSDIELIPAFDESNELAPIRRALHQTGSMNCPTYDNLRSIQKQWIDVSEAGGTCIFLGNGQSHYEKPFLTANPKKFEKTVCKTIALEMREYTSSYFGKEIDSDSMGQLIRVLNYAHDQGGRRIILINQTTYSSEELLHQIKKQLPKSECERTWSRLMLLLCETEESIFKHDQYNGRIKTTILEKHIAHEKGQEFNLLSHRRISPFLKGLKDFKNELLPNSFLYSENDMPNRHFTSAAKGKTDFQSLLSKIQLSFFKDIKRLDNKPAEERQNDFNYK